MLIRDTGGYDYEGEAEVRITRYGMRKLKYSLRKWLKRRSVKVVPRTIEPVIGHMKNEGRLDRNYLLGKEGDKMNAILCGAGHNMRKLLRAFPFFIFGWRVKEEFPATNLGEEADTSSMPAKNILFQE